jgi:hypothetical protein
VKSRAIDSSRDGNFVVADWLLSTRRKTVSLPWLRINLPFCDENAHARQLRQIFAAIRKAR